MLYTPARRLLWSVPLVALLAAPSAGAPPELRALIQRLDADVLADREDAQQRLMNDPRFGIDEVGAMLREDGLSPEQRRRLERAALNLFRLAPRAGMGVHFVPTPEGIVINSTVPEFPVSEVLRAGDLIVEVDGEAVAGDRAFQEAILSYRPGETMRLVYLREGERREAEVRLGSYMDLASRQRLDDDVLRGAMRVRFRRVLGPEVRKEVVIASAIDEDAWVEAVSGGDPADEGRWGRRAVSREVAVGGASRTGMEESSLMVWVRSEPGEADPELLKLGLAQLRTREMQYRAQLMGAEERLAAMRQAVEAAVGELEVGDVQRLLEALEDEEEQLAITRERLEGVRAELLRRGQVPIPLAPVGAPNRP